MTKKEQNNAAIAREVEHRKTSRFEPQPKRHAADTMNDETRDICDDSETGLHDWKHACPGWKKCADCGGYRAIAAAETSEIAIDMRKTSLSADANAPAPTIRIGSRWVNRKSGVTMLLLNAETTGCATFEEWKVGLFERQTKPHGWRWDGTCEQLLQQWEEIQ